MRTEEEILEAVRSTLGIVMILDNLEEMGLTAEEIATYLKQESDAAGAETLHPEFVRGMLRAFMWMVGTHFGDVDEELNDILQAKDFDLDSDSAESRSDPDSKTEG